MNYIGEFDNLESTKYKVIITTQTEGENQEFEFGETPVMLTINGGELYQPIKPLSATIQIATKEVLDDIYAQGYFDVTVKIYDMDNNVILFDGYVVPQQYNQDYRYFNVVEIECVSILSSLINRKYNKTQTYCYIYDLINEYLGHNVYIDSKFYDSFNIAVKEDIIYSDKNQPWTIFEIFEKSLTLYGLTLIEQNNKYYIIDYKSINLQSNINLKNIYDQTVITYNIEKNINKYKCDSPNIELTESYSSVEAVANIEEYESEIVMGDSRPTPFDNTGNFVKQIEPCQDGHGKSGSEDYVTKFYTHFIQGWRDYKMDMAYYQSIPFCLGSIDYNNGQYTHTIETLSSFDTTNKLQNLVSQAQTKMDEYISREVPGAYDDVFDASKPWAYLNHMTFHPSFMSNCAVGSFLTRWYSMKNEAITTPSFNNEIKYPNDANKYIFTPWWNASPSACEIKENIFFSSGIAANIATIINSQTADNMDAQSLSAYVAENLYHDENHPLFTYKSNTWIDYTIPDNTQEGFIVIKNVKFNLNYGAPIEAITDPVVTQGVDTQMHGWKTDRSLLKDFNDSYCPQKVLKQRQTPLWTPYKLSMWNTGWAVAEMRIKIGDYYYNQEIYDNPDYDVDTHEYSYDIRGYWDTNPNNRLIIYAHDEDVPLKQSSGINAQIETLSTNKWLKTVRNWNYGFFDCDCGENDIVITIPPQMHIEGELQIDIWPYWSYDEENVASVEGQTQIVSAYNPHPLRRNRGQYPARFIFPYSTMPDYIMMDIPKIEYKVSDYKIKEKQTVTYHQPWMDDEMIVDIFDKYNKEKDETENEDEEIIYKHENTTRYDYINNEIEFDVCSWRSEKPFAKSYVVNSIGQFQTIQNPYGEGEVRPEQMTVDKVAEHYNSPKYIYNVGVNHPLNVFDKFTTTTTNNKSFAVDTQEFDLKHMQNNIKLIEF